MIQVNGLKKEYKTGNFVQKALDGVSINFGDNEFAAILGPSGSGKTTLLNILGGLDTADSGEIIINGISTKDYKSADWDTYRNHSIGFVFQSYNLIPHQTVRANVELAMTLTGVDSEERRIRALNALEKVGLKGHENKKPNQLSGGQMQRVAIARAIVNNPDIVLADEPTGALDTDTGVQVMNILKEISEDRLVIMVTHNPALGKKYANRIITLKDGKILEDSKPIENPERTGFMKRKKTPGKKRSSMSFKTALSLSFANLMSKKGRTSLTAFAGSIGIIGIAAILALSNGVNGYISKVEEDTLSSYPLTISKTSTDIWSMFSGMSGNKNSGSNKNQAKSTINKSNNEEDDRDEIKQNSVMSSIFGDTRKNDLKSFKKYLDKKGNPVRRNASVITYNYGIEPLIYQMNHKDGPVQVNTSAEPNQNYESFGLKNTGSTGFYEMLDDEKLLKSQYKIVAGKWPKTYDEAVLVLNKDGSISDYNLYEMGYYDRKSYNEAIETYRQTGKLELDTQHRKFKYKDALKLKYKVISPGEKYQYNSSGNAWLDQSKNIDFIKGQLDKGIDLKVVGVIKPNGKSRTSALETGISYTPWLTSRIIERMQEAEIVKDQLSKPDIDVFTGKSFEELKRKNGGNIDMSRLFSINQAALAGAFKFDESKLGLMFARSPLANINYEKALKGVDMNALSQAMMNKIMEELAGLPAYLQQQNITLTIDQANIITQQASNLTMDLLAGYPEFARKYSEEHQNAGQNDVISAYLAGNETREKIRKSSIDLAAKLGNTDLAKTLEKAISSYMQGRLRNIMGEFMNSVMIGMENQIASQMQGAGAEAADAMNAIQSAIKINMAAFAGAFKINMDQGQMTALFSQLMNKEATNYDSNLKKMGYAVKDNPESISIYPRSFEKKDKVMAGIDNYNKQMKSNGEKSKVITYSDIMGTLMSSVTDIIKMISYVLVAFVSVSLIVSSIMIGIITYISVLERKKEIGILRAMGASKRNIANIFNAETIIEGLLSGVFAIAIVYLAGIPVNWIVLRNFNVERIMRLPVSSALILIGISVFLTFIAGLIPSRSAAKRDPVESLRSE